MALSDDVVLAQCAATITEFGDATLEIRVADYGTLLLSYAIASFATPAMDTGFGIIAAAGVPIAETGIATGTAGSFQLRDGNDAVKWQETGAGAVGTDPATSIAVLTTDSIVSGESIPLTSFRLGINSAVGPEGA